MRPTGLLLFLVCAVRASSWAQAPELDTVPSPPSGMLSPWVEPLPLALVVDGAARGTVQVYVPLGVTFTRGGLPWNVEVGGAVLSRESVRTRESLTGLSGLACPLGCWFAAVGFGPSLRLTAPDPISGWFVEPRLTAFVGSYHAAVTLGVDTGYRFRMGAFYVAPLLGLGVGVGMSNPFASYYLPDLVPVIPDYSPVRFGFRLNLLRVGWAPQGFPGPIGFAGQPEMVTRFAVITSPLVFGLPPNYEAGTSTGGPRFSLSALAPVWRGHLRLGVGYRFWGGWGASGSLVAALVGASYTLVKGVGGELAVELSLRGEVGAPSYWSSEKLFAGGAAIHAVYRFRRGPVYLGASVGPAFTASTGAPWWQEVQPATAFAALTLTSTYFTRLQLEVEPLLIGVAF